MHFSLAECMALLLGRDGDNSVILFMALFMRIPINWFKTDFLSIETPPSFAVGVC